MPYLGAAAPCGLPFGRECFVVSPAGCRHSESLHAAAWTFLKSKAIRPDTFDPDGASKTRDFAG